MNVTKENFQEAAEQIEKLLPTAAFVSFDEEMTGISIPGQSERFEDTPAKRYSKMRAVGSRYNIIQFGLAIFHRKPKEEGAEAPEGQDAYEAHVYNFYLFPEKGPINMEGSAVAFNTNHGMDWNKWIREGVPYVTREAAQKLRDSMLPVLASSAPAAESVKKEEPPRNRLVLTKEADIETTTKAFDGLKLWLADDSKKEETEFEVLTTNAYLRRFCYEVLAADFPHLTVESRPTAARGISALVALRLTEAMKAERDAKLRASKEAELARKVGFTRIFRAMADAKKPVVGHALVYDLLFALSHFDGPLPESYADFKALVSGLFPFIFDTQVLIRSEPFKFLPPAPDAAPDAQKQQRFGSMALGAVYKVFQEESAAAKSAGKPTVDVSFAVGHDRYGVDCKAFHEAGYDAYITGFAFAQMAKYALSPELIDRLNGRSTMFRSMFHFNLVGEEVPIVEGVYVHVNGLVGVNAVTLKGSFPEISAREPAKPAEAEKLGEAEKALDAEKPVMLDKLVEPEIRWIDDANAFVVFPEAFRGDVAKMLDARKAMPREATGFKLTSWDEWFASQAATDPTPGAHVAADAREPPLKKARVSADSSM